MTQTLRETMRRGACPSLSAPMQTGDGYLARVALTGPATPLALIGLCEAALRHGSGLIDISARGNLQARGLTAESAVRFEANIRALGLPLRAGIAIDTGPLAGLDPQETRDPRPLAEAIRQGVERLGLAERLAAKTAVVVDGGGRLTLSALLADIRLRAAGDGWLLFTGGTERSESLHAPVCPEEAPAMALALLAAMAERGRRFRGRDFTVEDVRQITGIAARPCPGAIETRAASPFGLFPLREGQSALGLGPAFGQMRAEVLIDLMRQAQEAGCDRVRPAPGHALLMIAPQEATPRLTAIGAAMGLVLSADDPRAAIAVCPGRPGCASAYFDTHALARAAAALPGFAGGAPSLHISGCAKGCAHPEPAPLTLSGAPEGIRFILDGRAGDPPTATFAAGRAPEALRRLSTLSASSQAPAGAKAALLQETP